MREWFNREISGEAIGAALFILLLTYGMGWAIDRQMSNDRYKIEKGVVEVNGYMKVSDPKYIIQEEK